jgi:hypothetical protein
MQILESTHFPSPIYSDGFGISFDIGCNSASKKLALIYHDKSTFHSNEGQSTVWSEDGMVPIRLNHRDVV